jgi:cytochrome c biogenesis protein
MGDVQTNRAAMGRRGGWRTLRSLKFGIVILLLLAAACGLGMLVPQGGPPEMYLKAYGEVGSRALRVLGVSDVFHSLWFYLLALALGVNLTACTVHRFQLTWRRNYGTPSAPDPQRLQRMAHNASWRLAPPVEAVEEAVSAALRQRRFAVRRAASNPGGVYLHAMRGRIGNWGSGLIHLSVLVIFLGVLYGNFPGVRIAGRTVGNRGFETQVALVEEGQPYSPPRAGYSVRLKRFRVPLDERGQAQQFYSDLEIIEQGKVVDQPRIWVNHPYSRNGYSFYQSAWGLDGFVVRVTPPQGQPQDLFVPVSEQGFDMMQSIQPIANPRWVFFVHQFYPDAVMSSGQVTPRSTFPNNPMAQVFISEAPKLDAKVMHPVGWIAPGEDQVYKGVRFTMLGTVSRSVLTVKRDPGIPVVWLGFWMLMGGLVLALYLPPRTYRVLISPEGKRVRVVAGAEGMGAASLQQDLAVLTQMAASPATTEKGTGS